MEQREFAFSIHMFSVGRAHASNQPLGNVHGVDVFDLFKAQLEAAVGQTIPSKTDCKIVSRCDTNEDRFIYGYLHNGDLGETKLLMKVSAAGTASVAGKIEKDEAAAHAFAYCIFVPVEHEIGFILLQQRGNTSNWTFMQSLLKKALDKHLFGLRKTERIAPIDYLEKLKRSELKRITFTRRVAPGSGFLGLDKMGDLSEVGKVTIVIESKRKGALQSFLHLIRDQERGGEAKDKQFYSVEERAEDSSLGQAKFTVKVNDRTMTVGADLSAHGRPAFLQTMTLGDDGPDLDQVLAFADDTFKALYGLPQFQRPTNVPR